MSGIVKANIQANTLLWPVEWDHCSWGWQTTPCSWEWFNSSWQIQHPCLNTYHWDEKASCGGIPYLMMAFRNALRCRVLKPSTFITANTPDKSQWKLLTTKHCITTCTRDKQWLYKKQTTVLMMEFPTRHVAKMLWTHNYVSLRHPTHRYCERNGRCW